MNPRAVFSLLVVAGLALAACGSDSSDTSDDASADASGGDASGVAAADLDGRSFASTEVSGHDLVEGSSITMNFTADRVSINAGCNTMNGGYTIDDGTFTAPQMAMTMMACDQPLMDQDTWLSEFLAAGAAVGLDGGSLTLSADDVTIELSEVEDAQLDGIMWVVTGTVANDGVSSVPEGSTASIAITGETVAIDTGCNTGTGGVTVGDDTLTFEPIATTLIACEPPIADVEAIMLAVLDGEVRYEIEGNSLSLRRDGDDGEIGLELTAS